MASGGVKDDIKAVGGSVVFSIGDRSTAATADRDCGLCEDTLGRPHGKEDGDVLFKLLISTAKVDFADDVRDFFGAPL